MHGWLPTGHMWHYITSINQCPGCECKDETILHLFRCPNPQMQKKRVEIIQQFQKKGLKKKVPRDVMEAFCHVIRVECKGEDNFEKRSFGPVIKNAIRQQQDIGIHLMLRDFLAQGWMTAISAAGSSHPERRMNTLQHMIWDTIMDPLWQERNTI